jgi:hypothetical protein
MELSLPDCTARMILQGQPVQVRVCGEEGRQHHKYTHSMQRDNNLHSSCLQQ